MKSIKKILVVGHFGFDKNIYTYSTSFYKVFKKLGYEVAYFNCKKSSNFLNDYLLNLALIKRVADCRPDLIFFIKANNILYKT